MKTALLLSALLLVSCSSKKKQVTSSDGAVGASGKDTLVMNGTSDDSRAGGLRSVPFDYQSDRITGEAKSILEHNKSVLEQNKKLTVQIEGHCDERGSAQYNLALGERRAKVVRDYLRAKGIQAFRLTVISYGKERPLDMGTSEQSMSRNRRGTFVVTGL